MNKKLLPWLITICALGLAVTAAYYSIIGLSRLFAGVATAVIIMASFLELSKIVLATLLHTYWKELRLLSKIYFTSSLIILSILTSAGIYGMLSGGYQEIAGKSKIGDKEITLIQSQLDTKNKNREYTLLQLSQTQKSIVDLRLALSNNVQTYKDKSGAILSTTSSANRKAFEKQLLVAQEDEKQLSNKIEEIDQEILQISSKKLEKETESESNAELGPLKYIALLTGISMDEVINWLILIIIFVFDPLAISLVIAANFAFDQTRNPENIKKDYQIYQSPPAEEPQITDTPPTEPTEIPIQKKILKTMRDIFKKKKY